MLDQSKLKHVVVFVRPSPLAHSLYGTLISINKLCCDSKSEVLVEFVLTLRTIEPMLFIWIFGYDILSFRNDNNSLKPLECFSTKWNSINFQLINKMRPNECAQFDSIWRRFSELFCSISFPETSACFIKERVNSVKKAHGTDISGQTTKKGILLKVFHIFLRNHPIAMPVPFRFQPEKPVFRFHTQGFIYFARILCKTKVKIKYFYFLFLKR